MRTFGILVLGIGLFGAAGCNGDSSSQDMISPERLANGLVIILPGIEGESPFNHNIRDGLSAAGVNGAIPIYRWGRPIPVVGALVNQMDVLGNRLEGRKIAQMIVDYHTNHPGKPVYIVGHSGGGGVAVFSAEALPEGHQVDGLILLSASISSGYDLSKALVKCRNGIVNFYTNADVGLLIVGTTFAGNVDGAHGPAAGAIGFDRTYPTLFQVQLSDEEAGASAHTAATESGFVATNVAPWVRSGHWPPTQSALSSAKPSLQPGPALAGKVR